jgi:predicted acetyltransferase
MTTGLDFRLCEFFVLRSLRGRGIGRAAAFAVFDRFRGSWEVEELRRNEPAGRF